MKKPLAHLFPVLLLLSCGAGNEDKPGNSREGFISVRSLVEQQVAHVDTGLYAIIRVTQRDTSAPDTTYIPREQFRSIAKDFLSIPDLSDPRVADTYYEEPVHYDETLNRVIITYKPVKPESSEIKKQELLVTPGSATGDKVNNILILREISNRDSFVKKDMLWIMNRRFQVTTTRQLKGQPETITVERVIWNNEE